MSAIKVKSYDEASDAERRAWYDASMAEASKCGLVNWDGDDQWETAYKALVMRPVTRITLEFRVPEDGEMFISDSYRIGRVGISSIVEGTLDLQANGHFTERLVVISREEV